jgi:3-oxoacyl-[acyl-carrier protein] reductase
MLKDRVAIVTGGTRGIGRAIVLALAREGVKVGFNYRKSEEEAKTLLKEVDSLGSEALSSKFDVRELDSAKEFVHKVKDSFGRLDILVNNAGLVRDRTLMLMQKDEWQEVIDVNLTGCFNLTRCCIMGFLREKSGSIVNITSVSGIIGAAGQTNYSAAKAGIIGFTKSLAREVAAYNIRVNAVAPGAIRTDMTDDLKPDYRDKIKTSIPKGDFGTVEDVANAVLFLLNDTSNYITGQVLRVDGGMVMS